MKPSIIFFIAAILLLLPVRGEAMDRSLTILYTGGLQGELEPCGCSPKTDFGGLSRLSGYINENRSSLYPYLLVDAGNFAAGDNKQGRLKSETLLRSFEAMNFNAVAFMGREKVMTESFFSPLVSKYKIPALSGVMSYDKSLALTVGNIEINIDTDPEGSKRNMLNILLTERPISELNLAEGWDLIISSSGEIIEKPVETGESVMVAGYPRGEKLGILKIKLDERKNIIGYDHRWQPLGNEIKEDPVVRSMLKDYDSKVAKLLKDSSPPAGSTYLGVLKCAECHQPYSESWKETAHARAFNTLKEVGKSSDPECLVCHSVGYGEKGGFFSIESTPGLENVQCETCHGLDREHIEDFYRPMKQVKEEVCLKCHTKDHSPDFDYPAYLEMIKH